MAVCTKFGDKMFVPWFNSQEWRHVKNLIYGNTSSEEDKSTALHIMQIWKHRIPKLPCGVEGTLILLDAYLTNTDTISESNLQVIYGTAVMRFLNLCSARTDKQGTFYESAKKNNIPEWLITVRHNIAHDQILPSLSILNIALSVCLKWIKENYWDLQNQTLTNVYCLNNHDEIIKTITDLYCRINLIYMFNENFATYLKYLKNLDSDLKMDIQKLKKFKLNEEMKTTHVLEVLLKLISKYLRSSNKQELNKIFADVIIQNRCIFGKGSFNSYNVIANAMWNQFALRWTPLFNLMFSNDSLLIFLQCLLQFVASENVTEEVRIVASTWLKYLFRCLILSKDHSNKDERKMEQWAKCKNTGLIMFNYDNCPSFFENVSCLESEVLNNPHAYVPIFLKYLLQLCKREEEYIQKCEEIVNAYLESANDSDCSIDSNIDELLNSILKKPIKTEDCHVESVAHEIIDDSSFKFKKVKDMSIFNGCPLGVLAHQNREINPCFANSSFSN